jgi:hypothetical protein
MAIRFLDSKEKGPFAFTAQPQTPAFEQAGACGWVVNN